MPRFDFQQPVEQVEPDAVRGFDLAGERLELAVLVEQFALRRRAHQRLEFMLAVHVQQAADDLAQLLHRHGLAIEVGARAAIGIDDAPHQQFVVGFDGLFFQQGARCARKLADVEGGGYFGLVGAGADLVGASACTADQRERIHHDGLAGTGFAGEHGEAAGEVQLQGVDDGKVPDLQMRQHGFLTAGGRRPRGPNAIWSAAGGSSRNRVGAAA